MLPKRPGRAAWSIPSRLAYANVTVRTTVTACITGSNVPQPVSIVSSRFPAFEVIGNATHVTSHAADHGQGEDAQHRGADQGPPDGRRPRAPARHRGGGHVGTAASDRASAAGWAA
ncbi:hypothetical protein ACU61A_02335 [Pseudonocardia sichuanensis]